MKNNFLKSLAYLLLSITTSQSLKIDNSSASCPLDFEPSQFSIEFIEPGVRGGENASFYMNKSSPAVARMKKFGHNQLQRIISQMKANGEIPAGTVLEIGPFYNPLAPSFLTKDHQWVILDVDKQATIENVTNYSEAGSHTPIGVVLDINSLSNARYRKFLSNLKKRLPKGSENLEIGTVILSSVLNYIDADLALNKTFSMLKPDGVMFIANSATGSNEYHENGLAKRPEILNQFLEKNKLDIFIEHREEGDYDNVKVVTLVLRKKLGQIEKNLTSYYKALAGPWGNSRNENPFEGHWVPQTLNVIRGVNNELWERSWDQGSENGTSLRAALDSLKVKLPSLQLGATKFPHSIIKKRYPEVLAFYDYPLEATLKILETRDENQLETLLVSRGTDYRLTYILNHFSLYAGRTANQIVFERYTWLKSTIEKLRLNSKVRKNLLPELRLYKDFEFETNWPFLFLNYGKLSASDRKIAIKDESVGLIYRAIRFGDASLLRDLPNLLTHPTFHDVEHIKHALFKIAKNASAIVDSKDRWRYAVEATVKSLKDRSLPTIDFLKFVEKIESLAKEFNIP